MAGRKGVLDSVDSGPLSLASVFADRTVLVTGHTGFKSGWLTHWLSRIGARVTGPGLAPDQGADNLSDRAKIGTPSASVIGDICDVDLVTRLVSEVRPSVVFHRAAQPLVRRSHMDPVATFATNVMGTAHVLDACRRCYSVEAVVCVTTDKVYENREWRWPYRKNEPLGGIDPYSASKSAAEMVARAYIATIVGQAGCRIATARRGNVIGSGDWSEDRIVPDIVRWVRAGRPLFLRHPGATRPWQHVLELCAGYLLLAQRLLEARQRGSEPTYASAWISDPARRWRCPCPNWFGTCCVQWATLPTRWKLASPLFMNPPI